MKLKSQKLIEYFGQKELSEDFLNAGTPIVIDIINYSDIPFEDFYEVLQEFPSISNVIIKSNNAEKTIEFLRGLPKEQVKFISVYGITDELELTEDSISGFSNLRALNLYAEKGMLKTLYIPENLSHLSISGFERVSHLDLADKNLESINVDGIAYSALGLDKHNLNKVIFSNIDRTLEDINVGDFQEELSGVSLIDFPVIIPSNLSNLQDISFLASKLSKVNLDMNLMRQYKEFARKNPDKVPNNLILGSKCVYNLSEYEKENMSEHATVYRYPACMLNRMTDFSSFQTLDKPIQFEIENISDLSIEQALQLKGLNINCKVFLNSIYNDTTQNVEYDLDQYIMIMQKMNELVGDIDESLPEEQKFAKIYERIVRHIEYDYAAAYPKNDKQKEYAKANRENCRSLLNGLLEGKAVCAGYAEVLRNACIMKGIDCEITLGPVDTIRKSFFYRNEKEHYEELLYDDRKDVITRGNHAWNKVRINRQWYNCDPTWDKPDIEHKYCPRFCLKSDEEFSRIGGSARPGVKNYGHASINSMSQENISYMFPHLKQVKDRQVTFSEKLDKFENTLFRDGAVLKRDKRQAKKISFKNVIAKLKTMVGKIFRRKRKMLSAPQDSIEIYSENHMKEDNPWKLDEQQMSEYRKNEIEKARSGQDRNLIIEQEDKEGRQ